MIRDFAGTPAHAIVLSLGKPGIRRYFNGSDDIQTIVEALFLACNFPAPSIVHTLLFIDEIQKDTETIQLLRYFYEEIPVFYVIRASSILAFVMQKVPVSL